MLSNLCEGPTQLKEKQNFITYVYFGHMKKESADESRGNFSPGAF